jgi:hypothetical protein
MTAPVASGWSISPGGAFTHWKSAAFARRTPSAAGGRYISCRSMALIYVEAME